jgi:hypothetical protein
MEALLDHDPVRMGKGVRPLIEGVRNIRTTYHDDNEDTEDDSMSSTSLLGGGEPDPDPESSGRRPFRARWSMPQDDFYIRVVDAFNGWRKTRQKSWRTFGRFVYSLLKAVVFSSWKIKVRIIHLDFACGLSVR